MHVENIVAPVLPPLPTRNELVRDSTRFNGLSEEGLLSLLGEPDFRRDDPPAAVWQYYGDNCVLDLFLYRTGQDHLQVAFAELRGKSRGEIRGCLSLIIAGKN